MQRFTAQQVCEYLTTGSGSQAEIYTEGSDDDLGMQPSDDGKL